jgi:putative ABC transport system permease protein
MDIRLLLHTILGLLLLLIPVGVLYHLERTVLRTFLLTTVRMGAQLLVLCLVVWVLYKVDSPWLLLAWLLTIAVASGFLVLKRCGQKGLRLLPAVSGGLFVSVAFVALWLLTLALPVRVFDPHWFVPVTALLMGHATAMAIRGLSTYLSVLKADEQQYEFLRGNGAPHLKALRPFMRRAIGAVISPSVANLRVLALTSMPLLLVGLFMGGLSPINAFVVMLLMVVACVSVAILALALIIFFSDRTLFDKRTI